VVVKVLLFAALREAAGGSIHSVALADGATVGHLLDALARLEPRLASLLGMPALRAAVNEQFASFGAPLSDGDEVALIPPVSGG
jgi:molybdopterin converting factor subunit 1